jgi:dihydroflavonol-4-reductase
LHVKTLKAPEAAGQTYLAISDELSVSAIDISTCLEERLPEKEMRKVLTHVLPNALLRLAAFFDTFIAAMTSQSGIVRPTSHGKAKKDLNWAPRSARYAVSSSAESLKKKTGRVKFLQHTYMFFCRQFHIP